MLNFKINGKPVKLATEWEELTRPQLLEMVPLLYQDKNLAVVRLAAFTILLPLPKSLLRKMDAEDLFRLTERCLWPWEKPLVQKVVWDFAFLKTTYLLPEPDFSNLTLIEYAMADHYFRAFSRKKPDLKALDNLVATLCRPRAKKLDINNPEWNGDLREKYNSKIAERRCALFSGLDMRYKIIVLNRFIEGQKGIFSSYSEIFDDSSKDKTASTPAKKYPNFHWIGLIDDLAEDGIFGDWEKTAFTNIHTVLFHLRKKHYRLKEAQEHM